MTLYLGLLRVRLADALRVFLFAHSEYCTQKPAPAFNVKVLLSLFILILTISISELPMDTSQPLIELILPARHLRRLQRLIYFLSAAYCRFL